MFIQKDISNFIIPIEIYKQIAIFFVFLALAISWPIAAIHIGGWKSIELLPVGFEIILVFIMCSGIKQGKQEINEYQKEKIMYKSVIL